MHPEVANLLKLQAIDARLEILRKELDARPKALEAQGGEVEHLQYRRMELQELRQAKRVEIDRAELEVKTLEDKIADSKRHVGEMTHDKEYQALQRQIERFQDEKDGVETRLLGLMDEMDMVRKGERELAAQLGIAEEDLNEDSSDFHEELEAIRKEAVELMQKREAALAAVDREVLDEYDLLFSRFRDRSVVCAEGAVCSGCHISVSPQTLNLLKLNNLTRCSSCSRILFL